LGEEVVHDLDVHEVNGMEAMVPMRQEPENWWQRLGYSGLTAAISVWSSASEVGV
jgi:hypothetical protein